MLSYAGVIRLICSEVSLFLVDFARVKDALADNDVILALKLTEETTRISFVARRTANLLDLDQERIAVAIDIDFMDLLNVAALFALAPKLLAAAAIVHSVTKLKGLAVAFFVHIGHHENLTSLVILHDHRNKTVALFEVRTNLTFRAFA
jgi:hypothetical protein